MLGLQGNTKQQSTLSTAFLSLSSDLHTKCEGVFLLNTRIPMEHWRCTYGRGSQDVILNTAQGYRPHLWASLHMEGVCVCVPPQST